MEKILSYFKKIFTEEGNGLLWGIFILPLTVLALLCIFNFSNQIIAVATVAAAIGAFRYAELTRQMLKLNSETEIKNEIRRLQEEFVRERYHHNLQLLVEKFKKGSYDIDDNERHLLSGFYWWALRMAAIVDTDEKRCEWVIKECGYALIASIIRHRALSLTFVAHCEDNENSFAASFGLSDARYADLFTLAWKTAKKVNMKPNEKESLCTACQTENRLRQKNLSFIELNIGCENNPSYCEESEAELFPPTVS